MKPILNIITAGSRIENLYKIEHNIKTRIKNFDIRWYVIFDRHKMHCNIPKDLNTYHSEIICGETSDCSGAIQKNRALEIIEKGWIYFLDDDNKIHPDFNKSLKEAIFFFPESKVFVFSQMFHCGKKRIQAKAPKKEKIINLNKTENKFQKMGPIDAGQYVINAEIIKETGARYKPFTYDSDRYFFNYLYKIPGSVYIDKYSVYYNALRYDLHPEFGISHFTKKLMAECGPQNNDYTISEYKNYDIISYKNNYEIISYKRVNN